MVARSRERMIPDTTGMSYPTTLWKNNAVLGLVDQCRDVADIHGLMQVDELAGLAQTVEELTKIFLHRGELRGGAWLAERVKLLSARRRGNSGFDFLPRPACGERERLSMRSDLRRGPAHPARNSVADLSPQAGRGAHLACDAETQHGSNYGGMWRRQC